VLLAGASNRRGPAGIRVHRTTTLLAHEITTHRGVPTTTPVRTLLDLAATGTPARTELALNEARARALVTPEQLDETTGRGSAVLWRLLTDVNGFSRSEGERRLRALVKRTELPPPRTNVHVHGHELDAYWPEQRLAVDVDGYGAHASRPAFERDRRKDQELIARGIRVARVTWRQLAHEPEAVVARLAAGLAGR
jgi:very-short-patch-repair endonuclease